MKTYKGAYPELQETVGREIKTYKVKKKTLQVSFDKFPTRNPFYPVVARE